MRDMWFKDMVHGSYMTLKMQIRADRMAISLIRIRSVNTPDLQTRREGYCDPTAGKAIQDASRIPHHVKEAHKALKDIASLLGFEVLVLRDRKTGRVYRWKQ